VKSSIRSNQQRLPLLRAATYGRGDFIVSPSNAAAFAAIEAWPEWPGGRLALVGPAGSGKTHLARIWAEKAGAVILPQGDIDVSRLPGRAVLLDDADRRSADELLFHLINMADAGASLLITGRSPPLAWPTELPDLRSRLNALTVATLEAPDDAILEGVLRKFFRQRNIRPTTEVLAYLLNRIERSIPTAWDVVARIDDRAASEGREITRPLAREVLEESGSVPDAPE
jgi:chromosomal replication initiation ATPase DnaA